MAAANDELRPKLKLGGFWFGLLEGTWGETYLWRSFNGINSIIGSLFEFRGLFSVYWCAMSVVGFITTGISSGFTTC
jgi:hypothetical protein